MEREKIEYLRERIRTFLGHPFIRKFFEEYYGLDPDKVREDLEYILDNAPDARVHIASRSRKKKHNLKKVSIEDIVYYLKIPRSPELNRGLYNIYSHKAAQPIAGIIALALAAQMHKKYGEIPEIIPPHAYTLRKAHEGNYSLLDETFWIVKDIKAEEFDHDQERRVAKILFRTRLHDEEDTRRELGELKKIKESRFWRKF